MEVEVEVEVDMVLVINVYVRGGCGCQSGLEPWHDGSSSVTSTTSAFTPMTSKAVGLVGLIIVMLCDEGLIARALFSRWRVFSDGLGRAYPKTRKSGQ